MPKVIETLKTLSGDKLIDIITNLMTQSTKNEKIVKTALASHDPEKLASLLNKEVSALAKTAGSYDYNEGDEVSDIIYDIIGKVDKHLAEQRPELAINILKNLIKLDKKLFDHIDDSYGYLGTAYYSLYEVLDKAFSYSNEPPEDIAKYIIETYSKDDYGNRSDLLRQLKLCLQGKKALALEKQLVNYKLDAYQIKVLREKAADLANDVDKYIKVIKSNGNIDDSDICEIAERLIKAKRFKEAVEWLLRIQDNDSYKADKKNDFLVEAYQGLNMKEEAQKLRWEIFEEHCNIDDYDQYIEYAPKSKKAQARTKAIKTVQNSKHLYAGVSFLNDIKEYELLDKLILQRYDEVKGSDYGTYRTISTTLAKHGKYLSATLLRRKLTESGVGKAQSKYYKYAASDYKLCYDYAQNIQDWKNFPNHDLFLKNFKEAHKRKKAFWALVKVE